ncbi:hypothetical protein [uncultured Maribacter sp.]|uniref:hypothetical protein n=1 Tax=uncultured Maribacter sp. TaxID=431308 RepID=UPI00262264F1|nr:hypothetical protein [uncultured Maribacter sp.]
MNLQIIYNPQYFMKVTSSILLGFLLFLFLGCSSSTKLMDSWKSSNFNSLSNAKILVISEHSEMSVRELYESSIANKLRSQNINAIEAHLQFPTLKKAETPEAIDKILNQFKEAKISAIILTSLKQTIETSNMSLSSKKEVPETYSEKASFSSVSHQKNNQAIANSKTYVLEAITYNLALEKDKQLVNVCLVDVTDPSSGDKILKSFTKIIGAQFQ